MPKDGGNGQQDAATMRSRWATRKLTVKSSGVKRIHIMDRIHKRTDSTEKKHQSGGSSHSSGSQHHGPGVNGTIILEEPSNEPDANSTATSEDEGESRTLFFNLPLPEQWKDEEGNPAQTFTRNKIRTAKYTPLSFIPKNIWFQFHNIANIFFLFNVILVVSNACPCTLSPHTKL
jgi:phospholipid-translocating ATPase